MIQLRTDNIIFNGLSCKAYNLTPCSVGNTDVTITTGLSRNITYEEGVNGIKNITKIQDGYNDTSHIITDEPPLFRRFFIDCISNSILKLHQTYNIMQ